MRKCDYCGRYFKDMHEVCPGCGSAIFKSVHNFGTKKITEVPKGGYKLDNDNFKSDKKIFSIFYYVGIVIFVFGVVTSLPFFTAGAFIGDLGMEIGMMGGFMSLAIPGLIGAIFFLIGRSGIKKYKENMKKLKVLSQKGLLIKNMPYKVKPTGTVVNGKKIYAIEVQYELDNGTIIPLQSEAKYDGVLARPDGTVDLLIDPDDLTNYFIDFEIY